MKVGIKGRGWTARGRMGPGRVYCFGKEVAVYPVFLDIPSVPSKPRLSVAKGVSGAAGVVASKSESNWSARDEQE